MAIKVTKTDELDKMFEEFATLPDLDLIPPLDKKKKPTEKTEKD